MDEGTFSIEIPPDAAFRNALIASLSANPTIEFEESPTYNLQEDVGSLPTIAGYAFTFSGAMAFIAFMAKHLSPIVTEFIKNRRILIKVGDTEISAATKSDLEHAASIASRLLKESKSNQSQKSKKPRE